MVQSYPEHIPVESITRKFSVNCLSSEVIELYSGHVKLGAIMLMQGQGHARGRKSVEDCRWRGKCEREELSLLCDQSPGNVQINW